MQHFIIYTNYQKDENLEMTSRIRNYLEAHQQKCSIYTEEKKEELLRDAHCMIVLGGDGTMLQAARDVQNIKLPLIGVNLGTLGYLAEVDPENLEHSLALLLEGKYEIESRMMVHGIIEDGSGKRIAQDYALNDIVVSRDASLQVIKLRIHVNGQFLKEYNADGVIITTPTGSTGYNLSAGGPIVKPGARVLMLTPISPHTLINRSIILSPEDEIVVEIPEGRDGGVQEVNAHFDGSHCRRLHSGEKIRIHAAQKTTDILRLNKISFLEVLHRKMQEAD